MIAVVSCVEVLFVDARSVAMFSAENFTKETGNERGHRLTFIVAMGTAFLIFSVVTALGMVAGGTAVGGSALLPYVSSHVLAQDEELEVGCWSTWGDEQHESCHDAIVGRCAYHAGRFET
jgi:hypothetical protein